MLGIAKCQSWMPKKQNLKNKLFIQINWMVTKNGIAYQKKMVFYTCT